MCVMGIGKRQSLSVREWDPSGIMEQNHEMKVMDIPLSITTMSLQSASKLDLTLV